jgi:hypothetical protein
MFQVVLQTKRKAGMFCICSLHAGADSMPAAVVQKLDSFLGARRAAPMYADSLGNARRVRVFEDGQCKATIRENFSAAVLLLHLEDILRDKRLAEALDASGIEFP